MPPQGRFRRGSSDTSVRFTPEPAPQARSRPNFGRQIGQTWPLRPLGRGFTDTSARPRVRSWAGPSIRSGMRPLAVRLDRMTEVNGLRLAYRGFIAGLAGG